MFEYKGSEEFDIGAGFGDYEYDFFTTNNDADDFWIIVNNYISLCKQFNLFLENYKFFENNETLSQFVQEKMKEHNANISITYFIDEYKQNEENMIEMIFNELNLNGGFDTHCFWLGGSCN